VPGCAQVPAADEAYARKQALKILDPCKAAVTGDDDFHRRRVNLAMKRFKATLEMASIGQFGGVADDSHYDGQGRLAQAAHISNFTSWIGQPPQ
jgi:hypothetical protein